MESKAVKNNTKSSVSAFHACSGSIYAPSNPKLNDGKEPTQKLVPNKIIGYRGHDSRNNLFNLIDTNEIVYPSAGLGVVMNLETGNQRFFTKHTDDIVALTQHPKTPHIIATGQTGKDVTVYVWNTQDMSVISTIHIGKMQGVASLSFSTEGYRLAIVLRDDKSTVQLWDWKHAKLFNSFVNGYRVLGISFSPFDNTALVSYGDKHANFWQLDKADPTKEITKKKGLFGDQLYSMVHSSLILSPTITVLGASDGNLAIFDKVTMIHHSKPYSGSVMALARVNDDVFASAADSIISFWSTKDYKETSYLGYKQISIKELSKTGNDYIVRSLQFHNNRFLVGTQSSDLFEIEITDTSVNFKRVGGGHGGDVNSIYVGLDGDASKYFVSSSLDSTARVWDLESSKQIQLFKLSSPSESITISHTTVAVGLNDGNVVVYELGAESPVATIKVSKEKISVLRYSPNNEYLAVGSHSDDIAILKVKEGYKLVKELKGHKSYIAHLDWATDNKHLQSNCGAYEILFWDVESGSQITTSHSLKDLEWATWTCKIGWPVQNIWEKSDDGTDINCVDRSPNQQLLATGDDHNNVNLFKYPVVNSVVQKGVYTGHSSHVLGTMFSASGQHLVSCGSGDRSIIIWNVI